LGLYIRHIQVEVNERCRKQREAVRDSGQVPHM
jgi:hypothetical protein